MKPNISTRSTKKAILTLNLAFLTLLTGCGSPGGTKIDQDTYFQLESEVASLVNSPVADAAPLEIKFIQEKLALAKQAKAERKRKSEAQYTEQIRADMAVAELRAELNRKNNVLLDKREQVSAAQVYLMELKERLQ